MKTLKNNLNLISGGNPIIGGAIAAGTGIAVFNGGASAIVAVDQNIQYLGEIGVRASEAVYTYQNPNSVGQMTFTQFDFRGF